jgi:4-amino-4-deoxy-L-arabinose transferase-like glycosyltransferase
VQRSRRAAWLAILKHPLTWIILIGFCLRLFGVIQFPVLFDEKISILDGVNKTRASLVHLLFRVSIKYTLGITPLYFWVERLFIDTLGQNKWGLRFFPLLSGTLSPWLAYVVVKARFDKSIATVSAAVVAFSDIFIWITAKSQYFEVLVLPLTFLVFYFATSDNRNRYYYISACFTLALMSNFGKSLFVLACFLVWYGLTKLFDVIRLGVPLKQAARATLKESLQLSSFLWVVVAWIAGAQLLAFYQPINSSVGGGELRNMWDALYRFTFGYGTDAKQFLVGSARGAFLVFNSMRIWPVTTMLFVPFVCGLAFLIVDVVRHWKSRDAARFNRDGYVVTFTLVSLGVLFGKGMIGERFHLFYFLPFAIICGVALSRLTARFQDDRARWQLVIFVLLLGLYVAYCAAWVNWYYGVWDERLFYPRALAALLVTAAVGAAALWAGRARVRLGRYVLLALVASWVVALLFQGPLVWGREAPWPPSYDNKLNDLEGDEQVVIKFAVERNRPELCKQLILPFQEQCAFCMKSRDCFD